MVRHYLKTWPEFFAALVECEKTFELRKNDRQFQRGDVLHLQEFDPETKAYSGREITRKVVYMLDHRPDAGCAATFGLSPGYVIMGLEPF
ncbi:ASCH/PUA domain-containing protein [Bradyrhizobium sp. 930_D9_N1_4]|uniref:ASCH/PUA domain-containing protein n=1 Tax=Bradyrhizobium sp. 930_D9_N1_4 TaxID=3240374 RepID=UPI003F8A9566